MKYAHVMYGYKVEISKMFKDDGVEFVTIKYANGTKQEMTKKHFQQLYKLV